MYSARLLGGLMLAFSLVSISTASSQLYLTCDGVTIGNQPAFARACVSKDGKTYKSAEFCTADQNLACCLENQDLNAKNCKTRQLLTPGPMNDSTSCSGQKYNGLDASNLMCQSGSSFVPPGVRGVCPLDRKTVCCIAPPENKPFDQSQCFELKS
ncbi:hypothetical protein PTTG_27188 [Puccinia triticina 1-1 BBBD Race 1]|uniref:Secreted protein n=2 Tax=Puccinia triticina TaxID=208348 RepID=A0A180GMH0_PUCT1|nr:uncharacterized protein PtA15_16A250 [Puccinia triticina]OAV93865.1 hypothetical protein PTTG_27188 [Puccinia triticina 1-1 BBBD Race 1]WAQ92344.1 hypothetical protein PtA15_16A250 [Puccinia triticina]WAR64076.1 hypothetical protein PtB15_16B236 [Puccinia triticina]